jgi:hypothetical protein
VEISFQSGKFGIGHANVGLGFAEVGIVLEEDLVAVVKKIALGVV